MSQPVRASILIVEDDLDHRRILVRVLQNAGYEVAGCETVEAALALARSRIFDLALLDLHVQNSDGLQVAEAVRRHSPYTAIVILTGLPDLSSAVKSIDLQVGKYLVKPVRPDDLQRVVAEQIAAMQEQRQRDRLAAGMQAAIQTLHEGDGYAESTATVSRGPLRMDLSRHLATLDGRELELTTAEFYLLWALAKAEGTPVSAQDLAKAALDYALTANEAAALIKTHISRLRRKLEPDPRHPHHLITLRHKGYLWRA